MIVRRTLSLIAVAFVLLVAVGAPASAATGPNYPVTGGGTTAVEGTKTGQVTEGSRTPTGVTNTGVSGAGLARTGGELGTLWMGLALLVGGGLIVTMSRTRRKVLA